MRCWIAAILCSLAAALGAQTWNVATVAQLDDANSRMQPGDEIVVAAGAYGLDRTIQLNTASVTLRGATGNREDVQLVGGGMNDHGVDEGITVGADDVTIRDLTVRDCYYNGIHTRAENDVDRCHIANVQTIDIGERHIKGSRDPGATIVSDDIVIDHVLMRQTQERTGHTDTSPDYIGGIDMMCVNRLIVRDCVAIGIHGSENGGNAAIFLWNGVQDATIERNRISGCAKGIALGNPAAPGDFLATGRWHAVGGIIRDNFVRRGAWTTGNNIGIELCSTKDVKVYDNTLYSDDATYFRTVSISNCEAAVGLTAGLSFIGNLVRGQVKDFTDGSGWSQSGNLIDGIGSTIVAGWFADPATADLHLTASASGAIGHGTPLAEVPTDVDEAPRTSPGDIGADQRDATVAAIGGTDTTATGAGGTAAAIGGGSGGSHSGCGLGSLVGLLLAVAAASLRSRRGLTVLMLAGAAANAGAATDEAQANAYDDAWQAKWVAHCRSVYTASGKSVGFVLEVGDSITHANPYGQWPRYGAGKTVEDAAICAWCRTTDAFSGTTNDTANRNGFYLAAADTSGVRGMTCSGGLSTAEFLSGDGNGGAAMPASSDAATARGYLADGSTYTGNLSLASVAAAFADAQIAVLMLGTNDLNDGRSAADLKANLAAIVDAFEARHIVVVLSTIPPHYDAATDVRAQGYCDAIRSLASDRGLPLIDFRAEILARRPSDWNGTLLGANDVHPTAGVNGYDSASDPYADGGDAATHRTGDACRNSGYLLRSWLTMQKLKEVKSAVVDGVGATDGGTTGGGASGSGTTGSTSGGTGSSAGSGGGSGGACGLGAAAIVIGVAAWASWRRAMAS